VSAIADELKNGVHDYTSAADYVPPVEPEVKEHLAWFTGLKLGLMMHWSPATQLGLMESWPLCDGEADWSQTEIDWTSDMDDFRRQYWELNRTFNPIRFQPEKLAKTAKDCGFKYVLFTTKHHDGFCMFDTAETDYKITSPDCPYSAHPQADITRSLFDACRAQGLAISAYFSKPDWHSDNYWHRDFGLGKNRNVNYDVTKYPEMWDDFVGYTHRQLLELCSRYGKIDVLWLDGGWVRPDNQCQDIRLGEVVQKIRREHQPHLIVCDRTVGGACENIVTPEQTIPASPLGVPWEACVTLGRYFSFHYEDEYKPAHEVVRLLLGIVSNGGSLALNITLRPDGAIPPRVLTVLSGLGGWMAAQGQGVYGSRPSPLAPHEDVLYTMVGTDTYAYRLYDGVPRLPRRLFLRNPGNVSSLRLLRTGQELAFELKGDWLAADTSGVPMINAEYAEGFVLR
jgi:alpha-L-fucosidase